MKKRQSALLIDLRKPPQSFLNAGLLAHCGEALAVASLVIITFFNFWLGLLMLLTGLGLILNGYISADPKRKAQARKLANRFLAKIRGKTQLN